MYLEDIMSNTEIKQGAIVIQKSTGVWSQVIGTLADEKFEIRTK